MIIIALLLATLLSAALAVVLAVPAGFFLMLLTSELHDHVTAHVPALPYSTTYAVSLLLSAWLLFVRPIHTGSSD